MALACSMYTGALPMKWTNDDDHCSSRLRFVPHELILPYLVSVRKPPSVAMAAFCHVVRPSPLQHSLITTIRGHHAVPDGFPVELQRHAITVVTIDSKDQAGELGARQEGRRERCQGVEAWKTWTD